MDRCLLLANFLLVGATFVLVVVTFWYAWSTRYMAKKTGEAAESARESAEAARRSASASEEMVRLERLRLAQSRRPRVSVSAYQADDQYGKRDPSGRRRVIVRNKGEANARDLRVFLRVKKATGPQDLERQFPHTLEPGRSAEADFGDPGPDEGYLTTIAVCHYTDHYHNDPDPRIYHSLDLVAHDADGRLQAVEKRDFTPEEPMERDPEFGEYLTICQACNPP